jgi:hypothetical protein
MNGNKVEIDKIDSKYCEYVADCYHNQDVLGVPTWSREFSLIYLLMLHGY